MSEKQDNRKIYKFWQLAVAALIILAGLLFGWWAAAETINDFRAEITINPDSVIKITEEIDYDFGEQQRHGIFRDIPVDYRTDRGNKRSIKLNFVEVTRNGSPEPYTVIKQKGNKRLKVGNPDVLLTGQQSYSIVYTVRGAFNFFPKMDELYWNITGQDWPVGISSARAVVRLPGNIKDKDLKVSCYQGSKGSTTSCLYDVVGDKVNFRTFGSLSVGEGMTLAVGLPKGLVTPPTWFNQLRWWVSDNWVIFLPVLALLILFLIWYKIGRDPVGRSTIIAEYEPPTGIKPTLVGSLVDEKVDNRDLTAGLIYLAQQGFLKINRIEKKSVFKSVDYELTLQGDISKLKGTIEGKLLRTFFSSSLTPGLSVKLSELKNNVSFGREIKKLKKEINQEMVKLGFYQRNPAFVRGSFLGVGIIIIFFAFQFGGVYGLAGIISGILTGLVFIAFSPLMSRKTKLGAEIKDHILGLKLFLEVTEKDRLQFHNAPEKSPQQFMKMLPYAVAMGVEKSWAEQFRNVYLEPPEWFVGNWSGQLLAINLVNDLSGFTSRVNSSFAQAASRGSGSAGGGFSGGGFGGGGGGSW